MRLLFLYLILLAFLFIVAFSGCNENSVNNSEEDPNPEYVIDIDTLKSHNISWEKLPFAISQRLPRIAFDSRGYLYNCNTDFHGRNILFKYTESGVIIDSMVFYLIPTSQSMPDYPNGILLNQYDEIFIKSYMGFNGGLYRAEKTTSNWRKLVSGEFSHYYFLNEKIYASCTGHDEASGGIMMSSDRGITWKHLTEFSNDLSYSFCYELSNGNLLAGGPGLLLSTNQGNTWTTIDSIIQNSAVITNQGEILTSNWNDEVSISTDNGNSWKKILVNHAGWLLTIDKKLEKIISFSPG